MSSISWYLRNDLNSQAQLFENIEEIDYSAVAFVCNCGQEHIGLCHHQELPSYICKNCGNTQFYNANQALQNFNHFLDSNTLNIQLEFGVALNDKVATSQYYLKIPSKIDFLREKVHYTNKSIFSVSLSSEGEEMFCYELDPLEEISIRDKVENIENSLETIEKKLKLSLLEYLKANNVFDIQKIIGYEKLTYAKLLFFLENPNFKSIYFHDIDYDLNGYSHIPGNILSSYKLIAIVDSLNREKSIKTAIFKNYEKQIKNKSFIMSHLQITKNNPQFKLN